MIDTIAPNEEVGPRWESELEFMQWMLPRKEMPLLPAQWVEVGFMHKVLG